MKRLLAITFAACGLVACGGKGVPFPSGNPERAKATLYSIYERYGVGGSCLLRENHPFDAECAAYVEAAPERFCDAGRNGRNVRPHGHSETQIKPITKTT